MESAGELFGPTLFKRDIDNFSGSDCDWRRDYEQEDFVQIHSGGVHKVVGQIRGPSAVH